MRYVTYNYGSIPIMMTHVYDSLIPNNEFPLLFHEMGADLWAERFVLYLELYIY